MKKLFIFLIFFLTLAIFSNQVHASVVSIKNFSMGDHASTEGVFGLTTNVTDDENAGVFIVPYYRSGNDEMRFYNYTGDLFTYSSNDVQPVGVTTNASGVPIKFVWHRHDQALKIYNTSDSISRTVCTVPVAFQRSFGFDTNDTNTNINHFYYTISNTTGSHLTLIDNGCNQLYQYNLTNLGISNETHSVSVTPKGSEVQNYWVLDTINMTLFRLNTTPSVVESFNMSSYFNDTLKTVSLYVSNDTIGVYFNVMTSTSWSGTTRYYTFMHFNVSTTGLNITAVYDEETLSPLTFNLTLQNTTFYETQTNILNYYNESLGGNLTVSISSEGYQLRNYYVSINPYSFHDLTGYLLANTSGVDIDYFIYSGRFPFGEANAMITALRNINGVWTAVEQHEADDTGEGSIFLQPDISYRINAESADRTLYKNISSYYPDPTELLQINLLGTAVSKPRYWDYYKQFIGSCSFNNATRLLTCTWTDNSGLMDDLEMKVDIFNLTGQFNFCTNTSTLTTGSLYCNFGAMRNYTYVWTMSATFSGEYLLIDSGSWTDYILPIALGITGILIAMLIILFSGFIGVQLGSPVMVVLMTMVGVGVSVIIGILTFGSGIITMLIGFFIAGLVLVYKLRA